MPTAISLPMIFGLMVVASPCVLVAVLGVSSLIGRPLAERSISRCVYAGNVIGLQSGLTVLGWMLTTGERRVAIELGDWVHIPSYHFSLKFEFDRLSVPFVILTFLLCGTIGAFGSRYLHRERGFNRFFVLYSLFVCGMIITSLAGTIETLFAGWEMVGLSSALLVGFFHERPAPVRNGLHVWAVYRIADAALLLGAVALHHLRGHGDFDLLMAKGSWPFGEANLPAQEALIVGLLFLVAAAGKSALVPFSGWLPRAMEGPTPSSAVFYGALSVHLGAFLLLRISPVLESSLMLQAAVVVVGLTTSAVAFVAGRVQTDIKSALSFASMTQVGIIFVEIGCGLRYIALIHILGHGCLRTLQFVRAPTLLHDYRLMVNAIGADEGGPMMSHQTQTPSRFGIWLYRFGLERAWLDEWLMTLVVRPFVRIFEACDSLERRWTNLLAGGNSRESEQVTAQTNSLDELL